MSARKNTKETPVEAVAESPSFEMVSIEKTELEILSLESKALNLIINLQKGQHSLQELQVQIMEKKAEREARLQKQSAG
jgi:hypothetical protein